MKRVLFCFFITSVCLLMMFGSSCRSRREAQTDAEHTKIEMDKSKLEKVFDPLHSLFIEYGVLRDSTPESFCHFFETITVDSLKNICCDSSMYQKLTDISDSITIQLRCFNDSGTLNEADVAEMDSFMYFTVHYLNKIADLIENNPVRFTPDSMVKMILEDISCEAYAKPFYRGFGLSVISSLCMFSRDIVRNIPDEKGLQRELPPVGGLSESKIRSRNVLHISVGADSVFCNGKATRINEIKPLVKRFFLNPDNDTLMSEKVEKDIEGLGLTEVSKGVVLLTNLRATQYGFYIMVQNEIAAAINELRDEFSQKIFGTSFEQLSVEKRKAVMKKFPVAVSEAEPQ